MFVYFPIYFYIFRDFLCLYIFWIQYLYIDWLVFIVFWLTLVDYRSFYFLPILVNIQGEPQYTLLKYQLKNPHSAATAVEFWILIFASYQHVLNTRIKISAATAADIWILNFANCQHILNTNIFLISKLEIWKKKCLLFCKISLFSGYQHSNASHFLFPNILDTSYIISHNPYS